jgi:hypothetical protein
MKASWQEDYFKVLIRLRLARQTKNRHPKMRSVPENLEGLFLIEPRCLGKEECTDEVIKKSTDFR